MDGAAYACYKKRIQEEVVPYAKPQDYGSIHGIRWFEIRNNKGGLRFEPMPDHKTRGEIKPQLNMTPMPYSAMELVKASHPYKLPQSSATYLTLDARQLGLGQNSCGAPPLEKDKVYMVPATLEFKLKVVG